MKKLGRRAMLALGGFLIVANILPYYSENIGGGGGGGYDWSSASRLLLGVGTVLLVFAVRMKPKDEPF